MSVAQRPSRPLLDNPFRPVPTEDPVYPSCYAAPVSLKAPYLDSPRAATTNKAHPEQPADIPAEIAKKNRLYAAARASGAPEDWEAFKRQRCHIGKLLRESRKANNRNNGDVKGRRVAFKTDFYCDACEVGFADGAELTGHISEHVPCDRDGCAFQACPQLVSLHVKLQHDTELIRRCGAATEEDAAEWRRQRRLRYPTLRNIEAKKAVEAELRERREMLGHGPERRFPARRPKRKRQQRRLQRERAAEARPNQSAVVAPSVVETTPVAEATPPLPLSPFRGVGSAETQVKTEPVEMEEDKLRITDSESDAEVRPTEVATPAVGGALGSLMTCYDSDSDDGEPAAKRLVTETPVAAATPVPATALSDPVPACLPATPVAAPATTFGGTATSENTSVAVPSEFRTNGPAKMPTASAHGPKRQRRGMQAHPNPVPLRRPTLLQKLLAPEIRHERNIVLQCVHYVVQNNFFVGQIPGKPLPKQPESLQEPVGQTAALPPQQSPDSTLEQATDQTTKLSQEQTSELAIKQSPDPAVKPLTSECSESTSSLASEQSAEPISITSEQTQLLEPTYEQSTDEVTKLTIKPTSKLALEQSAETLSEQTLLLETTSEQSTDEATKMCTEATSRGLEPTSDPISKEPAEHTSEQTELLGQTSEQSTEEAVNLSTERTSNLATKQLPELASEPTFNSSEQTSDSATKQLPELGLEQFTNKAVVMFLEPTSECSQQIADSARGPSSQLASGHGTK
uniref:C2H2-type domain-containing protein n=1 Tax=Ixodes ricinus TaxID=34613 RepID=A0A6B0VH27_IXORI